MRDYYTIVESKIEYDGTDELTIHKLNSIYATLERFFEKYGKECDFFFETDDCFAFFWCDNPFDFEIERCFRLKKFSGWKKLFRVVYKLKYTENNGNEKTEYFFRQKDIYDKIERLCGKKVLLTIPDGWGTPVKVFECDCDDEQISARLASKGKKIEGFDVEYIMIQDYDEKVF